METLATICHKTSDGQLFEDERKARSHQEDIVGEMLDGLLPNDDRGNVTRSDRHNLLMKMLKDEDLVKKINALHHALSFTEGE